MAKSSTWRFVLGTIVAFILGNAIWALIILVANKMGAPSFAQSIAQLRDVYNIVDAILLSIGIMLLVFHRSSSEDE